MKSIKLFYNKISLFYITTAILLIARIVHAHFIEDENVEEGEVIDKELESFKSLINGLETIKADDIDYFDGNENDNNDDTSISDIINELVNDNFNNKENLENNDDEKDLSEEQKDKNKTESELQGDNNKNENKVQPSDGKVEDNGKIENIEEQENDKVDNKENESKEDLNDDKDKIDELSNLNNNNSEEKPKKIQLVTEHQTFKEGNNNHNDDTIDKESDEDIKSLVKVIVASEGSTGDEAAKKEDDMLQKVKEAIDNNRVKAHNSKLEDQAKDEELNKNKDISESEGKHTKINSENNIPDGVFKIEESFVYKCFFDQECTNFKGFTPDVASCNKTSRRCSNYCFVQKACLSDSDCSTSCGSWCLKEDEMVFGRCVMSFDEGDFCMESWRVCNDDLVCNINSYVCEKPRIPITFTRIDSQESLLSIIIFLLVAIYLIKNSRSHNFVSFFSGYNLNEYCSNGTQEYDPLPEYQRTEVLNSDEMDDLIAPPPETDAPSNVEEAAAYCGYIDENNNNTVNCNYIPLQYRERPVPYDPYDEPVVPYDVPPSGDPSIEDLSSINNVPSVDENGNINVHIPSVSSLSDTNLVDLPPDYDETIFNQ